MNELAFFFKFRRFMFDTGIRLPLYIKSAFSDVLCNPLSAFLQQKAISLLLLSIATYIFIKAVLLKKKIVHKMQLCVRY